MPHAVTSYDPSDTSATTYSYDKNGNQTGRGSHDLTWDPNNRLVEYDNGADVTEYVYDTEGRRVIRIADAAGTPTVTYYIGGYEIQNPGGSEIESTYYSFAGTQVAVRVDDGTTDTRHYLITDHLGSNSVSVEYETTTKNRTFYQPYGEVRATTGGGVDTDHTYTGQIHDGTATGLMYYNARYYDPTLRRFISADTIVPDPANPQDHNRYTYVRNNPLKYTDPSGHCIVNPERGLVIDGNDSMTCDDLADRGLVCNPFLGDHCTPIPVPEYDEVCVNCPLPSGYVRMQLLPTNDFESIEYTISVLRDLDARFGSGSFGASADYVRLAVFMRPGGEGDIKLALKRLQDDDNYFWAAEDMVVNRDVMGNLLYGYLAKKAGVPPAVATVVGVLDGGSNDARDQVSVDAGYRLFDLAGGDASAVTRELVISVLDRPATSLGRWTLWWRQPDT